MRLPAALLTGTLLVAQSVQILPSPPPGGGRGMFYLMLVSPAAKPIAAMQWRLVAPPEVTLTQADIEPGSAAREAHKSVSCAALKPGAAMVCVLSGGRQPIPNGPIAKIRFTAPRGARAVTFHLGDISGASPDGKAARLESVSASIDVSDPGASGAGVAAITISSQKSAQTETLTGRIQPEERAPGASGESATQFPKGMRRAHSGDNRMNTGADHE